MLAIYIGVQMFMMTYRYLDGVKNGKVIKKKGIRVGGGFVHRTA